jgi:hypothetical protein
MLDAELLLALDNLYRRGQAILVVFIAATGTPAPPRRFPIIRIDYDENWSQRDTLVLGG